jgi:Rha family phage regulatory protein
MENLVLLKEETLVVSSRLFAEGFDVEHRALLQLIKTHQESIENNFGRITFEMDTLETKGGLQESKFAYLTEDQVMFIGTLLRNSQKAVQFKVKLVLAFSKMKEELQKRKLLLPQTYKEALVALVKEVEEKEQLILQVENLNTVLDNLLDWVSIIKVCVHNSVKESNFNWRVLKKKSEDLGYAIKKAESVRYDFQNLYHITVFKACYPQYNYNFKEDTNNKSLNL